MGNTKCSFLALFLLQFIGKVENIREKQKLNLCVEKKTFSLDVFS